MRNKYSQYFVPPKGCQTQLVLYEVNVLQFFCQEKCFVVMRL